MTIVLLIMTIVLIVMTIVLIVMTIVLIVMIVSCPYCSRDEIMDVRTDDHKIAEQSDI
jgi:cell division protein FtsL